jgi:sulfate transport system substrate-binding protein
MIKRSLALALLGIGLLGSAGCGSSGDSGSEILNISYDPTHELYNEYNPAFTQYWKQKTGQTVTVNMSHGGSGKQARKVIDGVEASVVTLALAYDVNALATKADLLAADWQQRLPHDSCPYTSTIVFLVRKGNPKGIHDWDDLVKPEVQIITPHPKTSGGARWNYLAAWGYALQRELGDLKRLHDPKQSEAVAKAEAKAQEFVAEVYRHVLVLDSGARDATLSFVRKGQGDVLLAWENEAMLEVQGAGREKFEIVVPSISILAQPPVALVDKVADRLGTRQVAEEYLKYLYSVEGQTIAAKNFYRPSEPSGVPAEHLTFKDLKLFTVDDVFGGWEKAQAVHFNDGGLFDTMREGKK